MLYENFVVCCYCDGRSHFESTASRSVVERTRQNPNRVSYGASKENVSLCLYGTYSGYHLHHSKRRNESLTPATVFDLCCSTHRIMYTEENGIPKPVGDGSRHSKLFGAFDLCVFCAIYGRVIRSPCYTKISSSVVTAMGAAILSQLPQEAS